MVMAPRLDQRQTQSLVMTPQLQQAIKLLQMSHMELASYVAEELETNPLLERDDPDTPDVPSAAEPDSETGDFDEVSLSDMDLADPGTAEITDEHMPDADWDGAFEDGAVSVGVTGALNDGPIGGGGFDEDLPGLEETLAETLTLREHLLQQVNLTFHEPSDRVLASVFIDALDDIGYLTSDVTEIVETTGTTLDHAEAVLNQLQQLDPSGVFARDLADCLAIQLRERDRYDPAMQIFVENLDLVAKREFSKLAKLCGIDADEIPDMLMEIRELDPKPGLSFSPSSADPITPDVMMVAHPKGGWSVELNSETLPRVLVNTTYHAIVSSQPMSKEDRRYLAEQFQTANWLVRALHQRATTILKVSAEIVRQQDRFFRKGVQFLKPLVLRDVADVIEMHESTVSRVTSNKYIATPRGIFELKYFFTAAIASTSGGDAFSAESVRHRIKALVDAENPKKILSDDKIVTILKSEGFDIARRTVAKYREAMNIGSSVERRRQKAPPK